MNLFNGKLFGCSFGLLTNWGSVWVGGHYSPYTRRLCVNIIPCVTFWITRKGGAVPDKAKA